MNEVTSFIGKNVLLGKDVQIWHFCYIGDNTVIGDHTKIGSLCHIDYNVRIGNDCKIEGMTYIPPKTVIGDGVFLGPGVIFTNDPYPESEKMIGVYVKDGAKICAGAMLKAGVTVGEEAVVGMGAVVTRNVPPSFVVFGNPSRVQYGISEYIEKKQAWNLGQVTGDNER